jgi:predicted TIM-barrel fold metal-dependent hydrolase
MHIPWEDKIEAYFCLIEEIKANWKVYDSHMHPVEVIFGNMSYKKNVKEDGIFSLNKSKYTEPSLINIIEKHKSSKELTAFIRMRPKILPMMLQNTYAHTGPRVFRKYFNLNFIDKGLMLPVAPAVGTTTQQMDLCHTMFKDDDCFSLAGSVPNTVSNQDVESFLKKELEKFKIIAVKVHPDITGIDLGAKEGKERLEAIISAGSRLRLPVIVHAGCSRPFLNNRRAEFGSFVNFKDINFDAQTPVVLAHGGAYELSYAEVNRDILPLLIKLLKKFPNLLIDISTLNHDVIKLFLTRIATEKILFGSDALYQNQSLMLMNLIYALDSSNLKLDDSLINIMSKNAASKIFQEAPNKQN